RPRDLTAAATTSSEGGFLPSGVLATTFVQMALYVRSPGALPSGGYISRRIRFASSDCGPRPARRGVSGADDGVDAGGANGAGEDGDDVGDTDGVGLVDVSEGGGSGAIAPRVIISGDDGSDAVGSGGGSCASWNGCWNRRAISEKARFASGDTILTSASFISGEVAPGSFCCTHSRKLVGLSSRLGMGLNHSMPGLGWSGRLRRPDWPH